MADSEIVQSEESFDMSGAVDAAAAFHELGSSSAQAMHRLGVDEGGQGDMAALTVGAGAGVWLAHAIDDPEIGLVFGVVGAAIAGVIRFAMKQP